MAPLVFSGAIWLFVNKTGIYSNQLLIDINKVLDVFNQM